MLAWSTSSSSSPVLDRRNNTVIEAAIDGVSDMATLAAESVNASSTAARESLQDDPNLTLATDMSESELEAAEAVVNRGRRAFLKVGEALLAIREGRGYLLRGYTRFEDYIEQRWGFGRTSAYWHMDAATVARNVQHVGHRPDLEAPDPLLEAAGLWRVASLATLPPEQQRTIARRETFTSYSRRELRAVINAARIELSSRTPAQRSSPEPRPASLVGVTESDEDVRVLDAASLPWPDGSCDLVLTSPPYCLDKPYAEGGDVPNYPTYRQLMIVWATQLYRVAHPEHGRLCLTVPVDRSRDSHEPIYAHWVAALETVGWRYRTTIFWLDNQAGPGTARGSVDSPGAPSVHAPLEAIVVAYRGQWARHETRPHDLGHDDWLKLCGPRGLWSFPGVADPAHPAPFPEELAMRCIRLYTYRGDVVADPFAGRGTTPAMATRLDRRVLAGDRAPEYVMQSRTWVGRERAAARRSAAGAGTRRPAEPTGRNDRTLAATLEFACLLCGRAITEGAQRCPVCGGSPIPAEAHRLRRPESLLDAAEFRARLGRPPKRVAEQQVEQEQDSDAR
jgi:site-specific DNA-methyltransferase (adenine-specific)